MLFAMFGDDKNAKLDRHSINKWHQTDDASDFEIKLFEVYFSLEFDGLLRLTTSGGDF